MQTEQLPQNETPRPRRPWHAPKLVSLATRATAAGTQLSASENGTYTPS